MYPYHTQRGFTLVEMIVSLALFAVVSTISVGTVVVLLDGSRDLRQEQSTIANVQFALDIMTRDIRTGYDYICDTEVGNPAVSMYGSQHSTLTNPTDCVDGNLGGSNAKHGVSFIIADSGIGSTERMAYYYDPTEASLFRRIGNNAPESILSDSIILNGADFIVSGTDATDGLQPTVTVLLQVESENGVEFDLQTTVTQRFLDIP